MVVKSIFSFWLVLSLLTLSGCQTPAGEPKPSTTPDTPSLERQVLTAFGDSLTEGLGVDTQEAYPAQLEARLQADGLDWKVVNAGLSGETSSGALTRVDWVLKTKPKAVLLVTGANDGLRGLDPELTAKNLDALVTRFKERGVAVMIGGMKAPPNMGQEYRSQFDAMYVDVAERHELPLIPFFLEGVAKIPELNQKDGKHPNPEGYKVLVNTIYPQVKEWLESL